MLEADAGHWTVYEQVHRIIRAVREWKLRVVRIEDVQYQRALGDVLDREARIAGVHVHVDLVKPDADKLRRANAWSPLVEDGTVLFAPDQRQLVTAMLAVPGDRMQWDLVDAAGLCIRDFPKLMPESSRIEMDDAAATRAAGYAVNRATSARPPDAREATPLRPPRRSSMAPNTVKRAAGYAVRPRSG